MVYILGINAFHADSSACLLKDGKLLAAAEEERFRRIKHWAGFPSGAIGYCLSVAGIRLDQLHHVAINRNSYANLGRKIGYALLRRPSPKLVASRFRNRRSWTAVDAMLRTAFPGGSFNGKIHRVAHHYAHLASAYYASPYEEAVTVSIDGLGDFASTAWGVGRGGDLRMEGQVYFPHSLGIFYQALTQYLGFPNYGDEYKVMGLAPYGVPRFMDEMRQIVKLQPNGTFRLDLRFFRHHSENVAYEWNDGPPSCGAFFSPLLENLLGPARRMEQDIEQHHSDIARSMQAMYEEAMFHLLGCLYKHYGIPTVALAGGCAFNSVANGRIRHKTPFRDIYIQPAAGDAGGAIGAAYAAWHGLGPKKARFRMSHAYWGPEFGCEAITELLESHQDAILAQGCTVQSIEDEAMLCEQTARAIAGGKVVGWFQGRMEWGPRALGNRSICCDPRRADMKDLLNRKIKRRESFRPFAPSVLREAVQAWFETDDDVPFMMKVYQIRTEKRSQIPAVTHVDGSGRLQTVETTGNPRYYHLIKAFEELTGVPMILNTSFNENEPVVCRPEEALDCFLRTRMDILVLGDFFVERREADRAPAASLDRTKH